MMQEEETAEKVIEATRGLFEGLGEVGAAGWPVLVEETVRVGLLDMGLGAVLLVLGCIVARFAAKNGDEDLVIPACIMAGILFIVAFAAFATGAQNALAPNHALLTDILDSIR